MTGMQAGPNPRRRVRWKAFAKYGLAFTGVLMLLWAIWNPQNRVQWVLTGVLVLATWGVWLGLDHDDTDKHPQPPPPQPPGGTLRGNPVTVHPEERRRRRDQRQP